MQETAMFQKVKYIPSTACFNFFFVLYLLPYTVEWISDRYGMGWQLAPSTVIWIMVRTACLCLCGGGVGLKCSRTEWYMYEYTALWYPTTPLSTIFSESKTYVVTEFPMLVSTFVFPQILPIIYVQQFCFMAVWTKSNGTLFLQTLQFPLLDSHFDKFSIFQIYHQGMAEWTIHIKYQRTQFHSSLQIETRQPYLCSTTYVIEMLYSLQICYKWDTNSSWPIYSTSI